MQKIGLTVSEVLLVVFVILKLLGKIAWSWWWVLSPIWIGLGIALVAFLIYAIILVIEEKSASGGKKKA